jgi:hypothetical protein
VQTAQKPVKKNEKQNTNKIQNNAIYIVVVVVVVVKGKAIPVAGHEGP